MLLRQTELKLQTGEVIGIWSTPDGYSACPVCGILIQGEWPYLPSPNDKNVASIPSAYASHNICPCCSTQYGDCDFVEPGERITQDEKWRQLRHKWLREVNITDQLTEQLHNLGIDAGQEIRLARGL